MFRDINEYIVEKLIETVRLERNEARRVAGQWYRRALRAEKELDRFIAQGVEEMAGTWANLEAEELEKENAALKAQLAAAEKQTRKAIESYLAVCDERSVLRDQLAAANAEIERLSGKPMLPETETCKWGKEGHSDDGSPVYKTGCSHYLYETHYADFTYCPHCGRRVR